LLAEAARKMSECRRAVPVWVMPLSGVIENFDPRSTRFDVGQSDVIALVGLYLGKTVLVLGDHEQVSPSAVGQDLSVIQNLIFWYLRGIHRPALQQVAMRKLESTIIPMQRGHAVCGD
jgi:hypothetical protein